MPTNMNPLPPDIQASPILVAGKTEDYAKLGYVEETSTTIPDAVPVAMPQESDAYAKLGYVEEKQADTIPTQIYPKVGESNLAGNIERTTGSAFSGVALMALNAVKGVTDLNETIPTPQFVKNIKEKIGATAVEKKFRGNVESLIQDWEQYRDQVHQQIREEGGLAAEIAQGIGDSALQTATMLAGIGASGFTGAGATVKAAIREAVKFGGLMAATTPGTAKDRTLAGAHAAAMMLLPIPASKLPAAWMAKAANIVGLNALSAIAGDYSVEKAKAKATENGHPNQWAQEWVAEGLPPFVINAVFGSVVQLAKQGNKGAMLQADNVPPEVQMIVEQIQRQRNIAKSEGETPLKTANPAETTPIEQLKSMPNAPIDGQNEVVKGNVPPEFGVEPSGKQLVKIPDGITYQKAQDKIDAIEERLGKEGVNIFKLYDPTDPMTIELGKSPEYKPMPTELIEAYKIRDSVGSSDLSQSIKDVKDNLRQEGVTDEQEIGAVLDAYALNGKTTDVYAQSLASQFTQELAKQPLKQQIEKVAIKLAIKRGEQIDDISDISKETIKDAMLAVKAITKSFGFLKSKSVEKQPPLPPSAQEQPKAAMAAETPVSGAPETTGIPTTTKGEAGALTLEKSAEQLANELVQTEPTESLGAAALNKLELATTTFAEPGEKRLRGVIKLVEDSPIILEGTKQEVKKLDPEYYQQKSKAMKDSVLAAMTKDASIATEAERFIRDPKESLDTKGVISVALYEHYLNTGNKLAQADLLNFNADIALGAGRYNQAFSMMNKLSGKSWITEMNTYLERKGAKLPEDVRTEIENDFLEVAKIKDEKARSAALHEVITKISTYVPFKAGEWLDAYRYTNMLFNPQSHFRNVYGNSIQALITRPLSLIARGDLSGTKTYLAGVWQNAMSGEAFRVAKESFKSDFSKFAESLTNPNATVFDTVRMEEGPQGKRKAVAWKALTFIPKLLNAQDKFFGSLIEAGETARLIKDGVTVADAQSAARILAEKYLYREKLGQKRDKSLPIFSQALDGLANLIETGRTTENPYVRWPMKLVVPFLRTPIRIAQMSVEASPLAWLGSGMNVESIARSKYGKSFEGLNSEGQLLVKEEFNNRVGLASVGTMVTLMGVGAAIQGSTTWGAPQDPKAKKLFYASGRRPYCWNPLGTNKWIPMAYLGPFFLAFALPAAARDAFADNPSSVDESMITRLGLAFAGIPKIILSQTPISGVSGFLEALQGKIDKNIAAAIGFEGAQFIPASGLLRWVNKMVDPVYRHPVSIGESIKAGVPGLSKDLKAYLDTGNKDAQRPWTDVYLPYTITAVDKQKEREYQNQVNQLKAKIKLQNILNTNKEKVRKSIQPK